MPPPAAHAPRESQYRMPTALGMYRTTQKQVPDLKPGDEYISLADQGFSMENMHATMRSSLPADPGASTSLNSMRKCEHACSRASAHHAHALSACYRSGCVGRVSDPERGAGSSFADSAGLFGTQRTMYSTAQGSIRGATMRSSLPSLPSVDLRSSTDQLPWMDLRASMDAGVMRSSMDVRSPMDTVRRSISLARFRPLFLTACTETQSRVDAMFALTFLFVSQSIFLSRSMESRSMTSRNFPPEPPAPIFHPDLSEHMRHQLQKHVETKSIAGFGSQRLQVLRLRVRAFYDVFSGKHRRHCPLGASHAPPGRILSRVL